MQCITPQQYEDIVEERAIIDLCGYPICNNKLTGVYILMHLLRFIDFFYKFVNSFGILVKLNFMWLFNKIFIYLLLPEVESEVSYIHEIQPSV